MKGFKSADSRLVHLFQQSREQWKQRAAEKQQKRRALEIKVRDLSASREQWKAKAQEALEQQRQLEKELELLKKKTESQQLEEAHSRGREFLPELQVAVEVRAKGHHYPVFIIQIAIQLLIQGLNSLRGVEQTFEILGQFWQWPIPDFTSVRQWGLRLGLYELNRQKEYRQDWIFIMDMTLEIGTGKCLAILGISQQKLRQIIHQEARGLKHQDVEVLALEVMEQSSGVVIAEKLKDLAYRVGTPVQIVSNWGSDIKKGIH